MKSHESSQNPRQQHSGEHTTKDAQERREKRRLALRRKSKRALKGVVRVAEDVALKGASTMLRVVQKLNRPVRKRINIEE